MTAEPIITYSKILWNCISSRIQAERFFADARRLGPYCVRRRAASAALRPSGWLDKACSTSACVIVCQSTCKASDGFAARERSVILSPPRYYIWSNQS